MATDFETIMAAGEDLFECGGLETEPPGPTETTPCHADCADCYGDTIDACCFCQCVTPNHPMP